MNSSSKGKVQAVLGNIEPNQVGATTTHEHLIINFSMMLRPPRDNMGREMCHKPVTMENLGWIRQFCYSNLDNLLVLNETTAIEEAILYRANGGGTIVDATTIGIGRNPSALARISKESGINIVMGAGYYVDSAQIDEVRNMDEESITETIIKELTIGMDDTNIKAGIIGEIGCTWPLEDNERKVLRAAAKAQAKTGASILIHPGRHQEAPKEILNELDKAGADLSRVIMGHLDRTVDSIGGLSEIASFGCVLEWDLFGVEVSYYQPADFDMPNDIQRLDYIREMMNMGLSDRIVLAQDICTKHRLAKYGGHGYGYILEHIVPRMRMKGFSEEEIKALMVDTPTRMLTIV